MTPSLNLSLLAAVPGVLLNRTFLLRTGSLTRAGQFHFFLTRSGRRPVQEPETRSKNG
jgi:hypothetical protein